MALTDEQRQFVILFVSDGEYNLLSTAAAIGVRPSEALVWFRNDEFKQAIRHAEGWQLSAMGYGPLRVVRDTLAIAHSDVTEIFPADEGGRLIIRDLSELPRHVRIAIRKIKMGVAIGREGEALVYPKEIEMHDKSWALKQAQEWYTVGEAPEVKAATSVSVEDGPKRIAGLIVRPPLSSDDKEIEDLLS